MLYMFFFFPSALMAFLTSHIQQQIHQKHNFSVPKSYERLWKPLMTFTGPKFAGRCFFFEPLKSETLRPGCLGLPTFWGLLAWGFCFFTCHLLPGLCAWDTAGSSNGWVRTWCDDVLGSWCFFFWRPSKQSNVISREPKGTSQCHPAKK